MSKGRNLAKLAVTNTGGIQMSALSTVVGAAPAALDTFNELAAALNNDANFATTVNNAIAAKQATLVSGTNIKTVNGSSLLGSGDITISGGGNAATSSTLGTVYGLTQTSISSSNSPYGNTVLGYGAYASTNNQNTRYNVVVGVGAYSNWYESVVLGYNAKGEGAQIISAGMNSRVKSDYSTAVGTNSYVGLSSANSTALGHGCSVSDYSSASTVVGYYAKSYAPQATSIGYYSEARGSNSVAIGYYGYASGSNSVAIGYSNHAYASNSVGIGYNNTLNGSYGIGIGCNNTTNGSYSVNLGYNINDNYYSTIILNASSSGLNVYGDGFYVNPIQSGTTANALYYDTASKQITYGPSGGAGGGQLSTLSDVSISNPQSGQVLTFQNGLWRNVTPTASSGGASGGASLRTNGFGVTDIFAPMNTFTLSSSTEASAFMTAYQGLQQPLMNFSSSTGLYTMMILNAAWNGNWYSLPPDWNPSLMYPNITQTGATTFSYTSSQPMQLMPLSNFPQYSDNDGRMWLQVNLGQLNFMQMSYNAQFSGPTSAKVWPNMYQGAGADPISALLTTLQQLATIDSGVHNVVIRVSGYNAITGQNTMTGFFGCTNITYSGSELAFSYATSQDYGNAPYNSLMFGIDIQ